MRNASGKNQNPEGSQVLQAATTPPTAAARAGLRKDEKRAPRTLTEVAIRWGHNSGGANVISTCQRQERGSFRV